MPRTKAFDKQQVLGKAVDLFWRQGYHATSMQNLVDTLGINRASLYDTFGGKRDLFEQAFESYRKHNKESLARFFDKQISIKNGLEMLFLKSVSSTFDNGEVKGCLVVNCTAEFLPDDSNMLQVLSANRKELEALFCELLKRGVEQGEFETQSDIPVLASYLFTFFSGLNVIAKLSPTKGNCVLVKY